MIDSIDDIAAIDDPVPDINDADLVDWIEQHQTLPLPDDDYPHLYRPATNSLSVKGR